MTRRPPFWIILSLLSISGVMYFIKNYDTAFPALSVDIKMNREMALEEADRLAKQYNFLPADYRKAVSFDGDRNFQTFVELEGGGLDTFKMFYMEEIYYPYKWRVRHFQEKNPNELSLWFTPSGKPYSFSQKLSEEEPGAVLGRDSAFAIALSSLKEDWFFDISSYELVDESEKIQPGGRVDHSFTFQRAGITIGENGFIRLRLTVQGDQLGELVHFAHVPEAFNRRFSEMRSANDTIAFSATIAVYLIYGLLGIVVSIFFLMRERRILWKKALGWGMLVGLFQVLIQLNFIPMMWMGYDTAVSENSFMTEIIVQLLLIFVLQSSLYTLSFIAAESLTRKAFPNHLQFWRLWSEGAGASTRVLGQTLGGYLATGIFMFYAIAFYTFVTKNLGWWAPADTNYDPNLLAAYFPWLTSIGISLGAGFWEECLFRAVPLAGAALIGDRYGKRNLFIGVAFVLQAIIFGAAHANYPVQPAYARLIELMIPSFLFGFIYLRFGLLAGIIMHYAYDVAMISLQLFTAEIPGIVFQRFMVILFLLIPLWVVLYFRFKSRRWVINIGHLNNSEWEIPPAPQDFPKTLIHEAGLEKQSTLVNYRNLIAIGIVGLILLVASIRFDVDQPKMEVSKEEAIVIADKALLDFGFIPDSQWTMETRHNSFEGQNDRFIWQEYGSEVYHKLSGIYLSVPVWEVRYRKYKGDVAQRAEQYSCFVNPSGERTVIWHQLPEDRESISLNEEEARSIVIEHIVSQYDMDRSTFKELEANSFKKPNRLDWQFIFQDTTTLIMDEGQLRITVNLAGDNISSSRRSVFVPEEWKRDEEDKKSKWNPLKILLGLVKTFSLAYILIYGTIRWTKKEFNTQLFMQIFLFLSVIGIIDLWSDMPNRLFNFKTEQPYGDQLYQAILIGAIGILFGSLIKAIIISSSQNMIRNIMPIHGRTRIENGVYIGLFLLGIYSVLTTLYPTLGPKFGYWWPLNDRIPMWGQVYNSLSEYINIFIDVLSIVLCMSYITNNWQKRLPLGISYLLLIGFAITSQNRGAFEAIPLWILFSIISASIFFFIHKEVIRFNPSLIPIIIGVIVVINKLTLGFANLYSGQFFSSMIASFIVVGFSFFCFKTLENS